MTICRAFDRGAERAIILVTRTDRHVIEAAVRDSRHTDLIHSVVGSGADGATSSTGILHILTRVCLALICSTALRGSIVLVFETRVRFDTLFTADYRTSAAITPLMIPGLLQLLALLQVAQLIIVRDQQIATTVLIVYCSLRLVMLLLVLKACRIAQGLSLLHRNDSMRDAKATNP